MPIKNLLPCILFLSVFSSSSLSAYEFAKFETFAEQENLWEMKKNDLYQNMFFNWLSDKRDCARWPAYSNSPDISFLGMKCYEVLIRFGEENIEEIEIYIYSRGDAGEIRDPQVFNTMLDDVFFKVKAWAGQEGKDSGEKKMVRGMSSKGRTWIRNQKTLIEATWATTEKIKLYSNDTRSLEEIPFRAEFIRISLSKFDPNAKKKPSSAAEKPATASTKDIKTNVKKDDQGFTYIENIPMVDQGQKGYCVVATAERIVRYYGVDMTQHDFAQLASTLPRGENGEIGGGTYVEQLVSMFKKIDNKIRLKEKVLYDGSFSSLIDSYNRCATKTKKQTIGMVMKPGTRTIDMEKTFSGADREVLREARCEIDKKAYKEFSKNIKKYVDKGVPVVWSVVLGIVSEKPDLPQTFGGHARMISGYNLETNEILYSDSWGSRHERKTMKMDDAWMITTGYFVFETRVRN